MSGGTPFRVVTVTKTYPSPGRSWEGPFIRHRMAAVHRKVPVQVVHAVSFRRSLPPDDPGGEPPVRRVRYRYVPGILKGLDHLFLEKALAKPLGKLAREGRLDLIDAHFGFPEGAAAVRLGCRFGVPVVVTMRGTEERFAGRGFRGRAMARALREADRVIAVSAPLARLAGSLGVSEGRIRVIGNGVDRELFRPGDRREARSRLGLSDSGPVIACVGGLTARKGQDRLIRVLRMVRRERPGALLVLVGDGEGKAGLRRLARERGVEDAVIFPGFVDREDLPAWFQAADVTALASSWEGWANVWLESLACGVPVVTTDVGAAREAVSLPECGEIVPEGDESAFGDAILRVLGNGRDPALLRKRVLTRGWEPVGDEVIEVFREALADREARR